MKKDLVDESNLIPTPCGAKETSERASFVTLLASKLRGSSCASEASYKCRGGVFGLNNRNGNPPTLTLPLRWGGNLDGNSGNLQSLLIDKHLFSYSPIHLFTSKRFAFTLAETLITLGVIGIVAAMTIPTMVNKYNETVTVTKVKKIYSMLSQAVKLETADNPDIVSWSNGKSRYNGGTQDMYYHLKPHLKILKECVYDNADNCIPDNMVLKKLDGTDWTRSKAYTTSTFVRFILIDGSYLWFRSVDNPCKDSDAGFKDVCAMFWYDTNGQTDPNQLGRDIFVFVLRPTGFYPHSSNSCYLDNSGWACSKWILKNGNMNYPKTKN